MKAEQIQSEIFEAIEDLNGWQRLQKLMLKLREEDSSTVLDGLLGIFFENSDNHFRSQAAAGGLLWTLKLKYQRTLREDLRKSLQSWDVSIEELPWYFAEAVGIEKVREEVKSLLAETLEEPAKGRAKAYLYWLSASNPEQFKLELDRAWNCRFRTREYWNL